MLWPGNSMRRIPWFIARVFSMEYIYKNKEKGTEETVNPERWVWGVIYNDGTELHQFDNGVFHRIGEIDQDNIKMFVLYKFGEMDTKRIDIPWRKGMRLIHKYINFHSQEFENIGETVRIYVIGYKFEGKYHFTYILPDDRMIMSAKEDIDLGLFNIQQ